MKTQMKCIFGSGYQLYSATSPSRRDARQVRFAAPLCFDTQCILLLVAMYVCMQILNIVKIFVRIMHIFLHEHY